MARLIVTSNGRRYDPTAVLPAAVMKMILYMLPLSDFFHCRAVSKRWRRAVIVCARYVKVGGIDGRRNEVGYVLKAKQEIKLRWRTGQAFMTKLVGHTARVTGIEVYLPLNILISCSMDNTIRFWNINTNREVYKIGPDHWGPCTEKLYAHHNGVSAMHLFGNTLATGDMVGKLIVWKIADKILPAFFRIFPGGIVNVCSSYGWIVCVLQNNRIEFIDRYQPHRLLPQRSLQRDEITSIDMNEKYLATSSRDGSVVVWKLDTQVPIYQCYPSSGRPVLSVKFCPKLNRLFCHTAVRVVEWHVECPRMYKRGKSAERVWHIGMAGNYLITVFANRLIATNVFTREQESELQLPFAYDKGETIDLWRSNFRYVAYTVSDVLSTSIRYISFHRH